METKPVKKSSQLAAFPPCDPIGAIGVVFPGDLCLNRWLLLWGIVGPAVIFGHWDGRYNHVVYVDSSIATRGC